MVLKGLICLTHNVMDLSLLLLAHSHCTHTFAQTQPQRVFRVIVAVRVQRWYEVGAVCFYDVQSIVTTHSEITFVIYVITYCSSQRLSLKTAGRCAKYIQARAQPEVSGACKQALGNPATWWRNMQPLPSRKKIVIFCVALTAQTFTQDIQANQYLMSLELGKLDYFWF